MDTVQLDTEINIKLHYISQRVSEKDIFFLAFKLLPLHRNSHYPEITDKLFCRGSVQE